MIVDSVLLVDDEVTVIFTECTPTEEAVWEYITWKYGIKRDRCYSMIVEVEPTHYKLGLLTVRCWARSKKPDCTALLTAV